MSADPNLTDANPQQEAGAELSGNAGDLALETAIDWMERAAAMLGRGEMPAPGSAYASNWCMAHAVVLAAARRSQAQQELPGGDHVGTIITFSPSGEHGNACISPEQPASGVYWTLIGTGPDCDQNALAEQIVARLNSAPPADGDGDYLLVRHNKELRKALISLVEHFERVDAPEESKAVIKSACEVYARTVAEQAIAAGPSPSLGMSEANEPQTPAPTTLNSEREVIALSASERACYDYPRVDQSAERDAFVAGAEFASIRPAGDYEGSSTNLDMVRQFHETFGVPVLSQPCIPADRVTLRLDILDEERRELDEALAADDVVAVADALTDMAYLIYGTALEFGIDLNACFAEVHRSNMSKLGADGKPIYREDGKVLKGPNYSPPDLANVLVRQLTGAKG